MNATSKSLADISAVLVAGGKGSRLGAVTRTLPKALVPVSGLPVIQHIIDSCVAAGVRKFRVSIGHLADAIEDFLGDGSAFGAEVTLYREVVPLGTAGSLIAMADDLNSTFMLIYADVIFAMDLAAMFEHHQRRAGLCTALVRPATRPFSSDLVSVESDGRIRSFISRNQMDQSIRTGAVLAPVFFFEPEILTFIPAEPPADLQKDVLAAALAADERIFAYSACDYVQDIGTPEGLLAANKILRIRETTATIPAAD